MVSPYLRNHDAPGHFWIELRWDTQTGKNTTVEQSLARLAMTNAASWILLVSRSFYCHRAANNLATPTWCIPYWSTTYSDELVHCCLPLHGSSVVQEREDWHRACCYHLWRLILPMPGFVSHPLDLWKNIRQLETKQLGHWAKHTSVSTLPSWWAKKTIGQVDIMKCHLPTL